MPIETITGRQMPTRSHLKIRRAYMAKISSGPVGSYGPSFTSMITVPDSRARTVCHWSAEMLSTTTGPPGQEFKGLPTEHEKDFPIPRAGWRGRIWTRMAPRYRACSYPGAVSANPRVPGGWNRFKDRKFSGRLQGQDR